MILQHAILLPHQWGKPVIQLRWWKILTAPLMTRRNKGIPVRAHLEILTQSHQGLCLLVMCQHNITTFTKVFYKDFHLKQLRLETGGFQPDGCLFILCVHLRMSNNTCWTPTFKMLAKSMASNRIQVCRGFITVFSRRAKHFDFLRKTFLVSGH